MTADVLQQDERKLAELGYKQELSRVLSWFTNFGVSFTIVSILTGITGSFGIAFGNGGPVSTVWGWVVVCTFVIFVALSLSEICSAYPTSGGLYYWAGRLGGKHSVFASWIAGWFNLLGQVAVTAGVNYAAANFVAAMILIGSDGHYPSNKELLGIYAGILVVQGIINTFAVELLSVMTAISVFWHVVGTIAITIALPIMAPKHQSAGFVFTEYIPNEGLPSAPYVFLVGMLMSQWCVCGYDSAGHMIEETLNAQIAGPISIMGTVLVSFVVGLGYILALLFSIQDVNNLLPPGAAATPTAGILPPAQIFWDVCEARFGNGRTGALVLMVVPLGGAFFCGLASVTSSSRMLYAFSRDNAVPGSNIWHRIHPKLKIPIYAVWGMVVASFIIALPMLYSAFAFAAVTSIAVIGLYISYAIPIFLRCTFGRKDFTPGPFSLGRFSIPVAVVAVCWVCVITVVFVLPTAYPIDMELNFNYASIAVGCVLLGSVGWWLLSARKWFKGPIRHVLEDGSETINGEPVLQRCLSVKMHSSRSLPPDLVLSLSKRGSLYRADSKDGYDTTHAVGSYDMKYIHDADKVQDVDGAPDVEKMASPFLLVQMPTVGEKSQH